MKDALGNVNVIAEDLGFLTDGVRRLLYDSGFPGMKVIQFAFDSREESDYLPHNYEKNCVVYTGTHDNDTLCGWYKVLDPEDLKLSQKYMNNANTSKRKFTGILSVWLWRVWQICALFHCKIIWGLEVRQGSIHHLRSGITGGGE